MLRRPRPPAADRCAAPSGSSARCEVGRLLPDRPPPRRRHPARARSRPPRAAAGSPRRVARGDAVGGDLARAGTPARRSSRSASRAWSVRRRLARSPAYAASWMSAWANRHWSSSMRRDQRALGEQIERALLERMVEQLLDEGRPKRDPDDRCDAERFASGRWQSHRCARPSTARRVTGIRDPPLPISATRPSRHWSVPSSRKARTVSPTKSGLPPVRSWMLRTPSASTAARATSVASRAVSGSARPWSRIRVVESRVAQPGAARVGWPRG